MPINVSQKHTTMFKSIASGVSRLNSEPQPILQKWSSMKQLHAILIATGLIAEPRNAAPLIAFSSATGSDLRYARKLFESLPNTNTFIWNTLIRSYSNSNIPQESLLLHRRMLAGGRLPNNYTIPFLLKSCARESSLTHTRLLHCIIFKLGFGRQVFVSNALLHAYSACREVALARLVFDEIPAKNVVSWNSMIGGYSRFGNCDEAFVLFGAMRDSGMEPDSFTFASLLSVCSQTGNFESGRIVHHYLVVTGADVNVIVGNALVDMYGKCGEVHFAQTCFDRMPARNVVSWTSLVCAYARHGQICSARCWFDRMPERSVVSWNTMISSYVSQGMYREGLELFSQMKDLGVVPDEVTLAAVLSACGQAGELNSGKETYDYVRKNVMNPSIMLLNSVVDMYAKCGRMDIALEVFNTMSRKDVVSWNVIIAALATHGHATDAIEFFECMVGEGVAPDGITFTGLLSACSHGGFLETGRSYFEAMNLVYKVPHEIEHYACMVDLLGRGGRLGEAVQLVRSMPMKPDIVIWGALLGAGRIHGNMKICEQVMKHLLELEQHNGGLYVLISNMYCEDGRWGDVKNIRMLMRERMIEKARATSLIEINGHMHEFLVADTRHEKSHDIYLLLDQLTDNLLSLESL